MKKIMLSALILGMSSAFALSSAAESAAMSACMKKGGTQTECQQAGKAAAKMKPAGTSTSSN